MYFISGLIEESIEKDGVVLTSKLYGSVVKLTDENLIKEYYEIKKDGCERLETLLQKGLHEQGILQSKEEIQKDITAVNECERKQLGMIIMPTDACNFRCSYCYEKHESSVMKKETVCAIQKFLENNVDNYEKIRIEWFGGEPTLCKESVLAISRKAMEVMKNKKFESSMTTNGYLLDIDTFKEFYKYGIRSYQITLDGWTHDETRPLADGSQTLNHILKNLDEIHRLSDEYQFDIILRHNILADDFDYSWYDYLAEKYGKDSRFSILVYPVYDWGGEQVKKMKILEENSAEYAVSYHEEYIKRIGMAIQHIDKNAKRLGEGVCYAGNKNDFVIRADGTLQKCTIALEEPLNKIGYLDMDGNMHIDEELHKKWYDIPLNEKCYSCKKLISCMNKTCPLKRIQEERYICKEWEG